MLKYALFRRYPGEFGMLPDDG
jgi:hypothetical protein